MYPYLNPVVERERRMAEGDRQRRIDGCRNQIFWAIQQLDAVKQHSLGYEERLYLRYLCGFTDTDSTELSLERRAQLGKLFEAGCRRRRSDANRLKKQNLLPGTDIIARLREQIRHEQSEAGKRKRANS